MSGQGTFDEAATIGNFWTDTIYPSDFKDGSGKYLNIVAEEDGNTTVEYHPPHPSRNRIKLTVTFVRASGDIKEVRLKKFKQFTTKGISRWEEQWFGPEDPMTFSHFTFEKLLGFLKLLTELDLANLNQHRIALRNEKGVSMDGETAAKVRSLLMHEDGQKIVDELLRNGLITSRDIVNIGYRKEQLRVFEDLLRRDGAIADYRAKYAVAGNQPEKVWQHFLRTNDWIFGFGLDYRFLGILQSEAHIAGEDLAGRDGAIIDFLSGAKNFTVLVEVKTPTTPLFHQSSNRANSWRLASELVGAVSQILEQKAGWQVKAEVGAAGNFTDNGTLIRQHTADPKCILIIGSDEAFGGDEKVRAIKLRTFELFRRDSRNVEIVTYDELFERARFIVGHSESDQLSADAKV